MLIHRLNAMFVLSRILNIKGTSKTWEKMNQMMNEHYVKNGQFLIGLVIGF
jgi:hypothetical protein